MSSEKWKVRIRQGSKRSKRQPSFSFRSGVGEIKIEGNKETSNENQCFGVRRRGGTGSSGTNRTEKRSEGEEALVEDEGYFGQFNFTVYCFI